jgi:hypothetical protein
MNESTLLLISVRSESERNGTDENFDRVFGFRVRREYRSREDVGGVTSEISEFGGLLANAT